MPLSIFLYTSFERSLKNLDPQQKIIAQRILKALEVYYACNCDLEQVHRLESRFFYKQLRKPYYEAGIESKIRVIIERDQSKCFLVLAGNHNQVRRFLAD